MAIININSSVTSLQSAQEPGQTTLPRTYQLFIKISKSVRVTVGSLGTFAIPAGHYVYTGSAKRGFEARIRRHLGTTKKFHWHIDYLLAAKGVRVSHVERFAEDECLVNQRTEGEIVIERFGASDCKAGCLSHFKRIKPD